MWNIITHSMIKPDALILNTQLSVLLIAFGTVQCRYQLKGAEVMSVAITCVRQIFPGVRHLLTCS